MTISSSKYFTKKELQCKCGCKQANMSKKFMARLDALRDTWGKPIYLSSAYRCPEHNNNVSSTGKKGPHTTGKAVDILIYGGHAHALLGFIIDFDFQGVGQHQKGKHADRFIHIDDLGGKTRPWVWSY